jgi:hypothetical protein
MIAQLVSFFLAVIARMLQLLVKSCFINFVLFAFKFFLWSRKQNRSVSNILQQNKIEKVAGEPLVSYSLIEVPRTLF